MSESLGLAPLNKTHLLSFSRNTQHTRANFCMYGLRMVTVDLGSASHKKIILQFSVTLGVEAFHLMTFSSPTVSILSFPVQVARSHS